MSGISFATGFSHAGIALAAGLGATSIAYSAFETLERDGSDTSGRTATTFGVPLLATATLVGAMSALGKSPIAATALGAATIGLVGGSIWSAKELF